MSLAPRAAARGTTGEDAATQKRSLQRPVAVYTSAAETGHLAGRVQPVERSSVGPEYP